MYRAPPPGHVPTCSLQSTDCRKAGGWHSTEMPSCWQLLLEAPDDIYTFKFCPTDPNIIAGGCINGQVVLWDIAKHADRLKTQRGGNKRKILSTLVSTQYSHSQNPPTLWCILYSYTHKPSILTLKILNTLGAYSKPSILWCILYTQTQNPEHSNWKPKIQVVLVAMSNFLNCRNCGLRISLGVSYVSSYVWGWEVLL